MKVNEMSIVSQQVPSFSMPNDSSSPLLDPAKKTTQYNREFSWKIASNLLVSFKYAWSGLSYAFQTQRNFRLHTIIGTLAIGLGVFLQLPRVEIAVIAVTIGLVMGMELLNTAIESVVDLTVEKSYHELAKIAKDCAAGAVLVAALASILVASSLLLPPLFTLIISKLNQLS